MAKHHLIYWYRTHPEVAAAWLYHVRDRDLELGDGIPIGTIIQGTYGFAMAEHAVAGLRGRAVAFHPTRHCRWQERELPCMVHPNLSTGPNPSRSCARSTTSWRN